jgi:DNA-binding MarR family transcriptional regulator
MSFIVEIACLRERISHSATLDQPLTLKQLFNSLKYSERGIRYVLDQFIDDGWCEVVGQTEDRRFRLIVATQRLTDKLREYEQVVLAKYRAALIEQS